MKRMLMRILLSAGNSLSDSQFASIPGISKGYRTIISIAESDYEDGEQWIDYENYSLKIAPPDFVSKELATKGIYEPRERRAIRNNVSRGDIVFDVGAHIGHHTLTLRDCVGDSGYVYAFEPNPSNATMLSETIERNKLQNVMVIERALGSTEKQATLQFNPENTGSATLLNVENQTSNIKIKTIGFEQVLSRFDIDQVDFIKMDVQGTESKIIPNIDLNNVDTLLLELHCGEFLSDSQVETIFSHLSETGTIKNLSGKLIASIGDFNQETSHTVIWERDK